MLAVDQREAMRAMLAEHQSEPVTDLQVTEFKLAAARTLTPYASAVLLDKQFVLDRAIEERAVAPECALIVAADEFIPSATEIVSDVQIDPAVDAERYRKQGAQALKLLVIYRPDTAPGPRVAMVEEFIEQCRSHGLISIIEPLSRAPLSGGSWDWDAGVLAAAREVGSLGADLYKAEMPLHGDGTEQELRSACAAITQTVASPWVVLSSGVHRDRFPHAVSQACAEGASGFLAGRAVWSACIGATDPARALKEDAVRRLEVLCETVDDAIARR
jgi:sulfofructosephosphate aldolase